jgi:hypothetical protein
MVPEDYLLLKDLAQADVEFVVRKDQNYSGSWRKRGGVGAYMMLARKWDRLENFAEGHEKQYDIFDLVLAAEDPEDVLDDIKDLRCYLLLVESYLRQQMSPSHQEKINEALTSLKEANEEIMKTKVGSPEMVRGEPIE